MHFRNIFFLIIFSLFIISSNDSNDVKKKVTLGVIVKNNIKNYIGFNFQILDLSVIKSSKSQKEEIISLLKEVQPKFLRFPGGTIAEHYHWKNHLFFPDGDNAFEGLFKPNGNSFNNKDYINIDEFIAICQEVGAQPIIVINLFTGSVDEATELVHYLNVEKKYGVKYFELGNDEYHRNIQQEYLKNESKSYGVSPEQYALLVQQYASALKNVDNTILIGAITPIGLREDLIVKRNVSNWAEVVNKNARSSIDWWAIHFYYFNKTREGLINYAGDFDKVTKLKEQLNISNTKKNHLEFLITEWNTTTKLSFDPISILYSANLFIQYSREEVNGAIYHALMSPQWGMAKMNPDKTIFVNKGIYFLFNKISKIDTASIGKVLKCREEIVGIEFESKSHYWIMLINNEDKSIDFDMGNNYSSVQECTLDIIDCSTTNAVIHKGLKKNIRELSIYSYSLAFVTFAKI